MFRKKSDEELWRLEQELIAAEEEDFEEEEGDIEEWQTYLQVGDRLQSAGTLPQCCQALA